MVMIAQQLESPFGDGMGVLVREPANEEFRGEHYRVMNLYYRSPNGHDFTTTETDELCIRQLYNQYRAQHNIPYPDELKAMRDKYGLSCIQMSRILGFGDNQYGFYERGNMPSESNGKILSMATNPQMFEQFVLRSGNVITPKEQDRIVSTIAKSETQADYVARIMFRGARRSEYNGFAVQSVEKVVSLVRYFVTEMKNVCPTMLNKLLFYADFYHYRQNGVGISGLEYKAIPFGCVPEKYQTIYDHVEGLERQPQCFQNGNEGELLLSATEPDMTVFSEDEIRIMEYVLGKFRNFSPSSISEYNHKEDVWLKNIEKRNKISYQEAFFLM